MSLPIIALATAEPEDPLPPAPAPAPEEKSEAGRKLFTILSIVFAIGLFVALPQAFAEGASRVFHLDLDVRDVRFQVLTGAAKLVIVVGYMLAIRRMPEIYRVFQYHGAEHKSIHTYEANENLVVENARPKTTLHPRCGTTFLVMVALVSIVIFTALGPLLPQIGLGKLADNVAFFLMKLPFLPVIAAVTFEIQRAARALRQRAAARADVAGLLGPEDHHHRAGRLAARSRAGGAPQLRCVESWAIPPRTVTRASRVSRRWPPSVRRRDVIPIEKLESVLDRSEEIDQLLCEPACSPIARSSNTLNRERSADPAAGGGLR